MPRASSAELPISRTLFCVTRSPCTLAPERALCANEQAVMDRVVPRVSFKRGGL